MIHVRIIGPNGLIFDDDSVSAITGFNYKGKFDILPKHARFISIVQKEVHLIIEGGRSKMFSFNEGVLKCRDDEVNIYFGF